MALASNTWHYVIIDPLSTPPWTAATYASPPFINDAIIAGTPVLVFCISDAGAGNAANLAFLGGEATIPSDGITLSSIPTMDTTVMDNGETWYSVRTGGGAWLFYGDQSGVVRSLAVPTTLGAFIS